MFTHGDIVKLRFGLNGIEYYIVTEVLDLTVKDGEPKNKYEIVKIFPVIKNPRTETVDGKQIVLIANADTKDSKLVVDFVMNNRAKKGWVDTPEFLLVSEKNKNILRYKQKSTGEIILLDGDDRDIIRYDLIETVDECLDRMNDLQDLHNRFGDEAYLVLKEVVKDRLKELI